MCVEFTLHVGLLHVPNIYIYMYMYIHNLHVYICTYIYWHNVNIFIIPFLIRLRLTFPFTFLSWSKNPCMKETAITREHPYGVLVGFHPRSAMIYGISKLNASESNAISHTLQVSVTEIGIM
ncbi:hypothetical protein PUN28_010632 [Cardiocondyla obscurior]|uniref:Uncharacterized protein n=1 Tax=Cardiocondyla obscurior TaxID=286306 RepID=A0AAW2FIT9_9HYME